MIKHIKLSIYDTAKDVYVPGIADTESVSCFE